MARRTAPIASIRIPSRFHQPKGWRYEVAVFSLGPGPCGLTVTRLRARMEPQALVIRQEHREAPPKTFVYPLDQLTGRVEIEHLEAAS
ncbi:hypothetical protein [Sphingomonas melonis]|uniref:hypothetical protein n=1 Tax=Sphingomonas melonis TaxID=152682 RepID=UPI0035C7C78B